MATTSPTTAAAAVVKIAIGDIKVTGVDGIARSVQVGDRVYLGETLQTAANSIVQIQLNDGRLLDLGHDAIITLDNDILATSFADLPATYSDTSRYYFDPGSRTGAVGSSDPTDNESRVPGAGGTEEGSGGTTVILDQANSYGIVTPVTATASLDIGFLNLTTIIFPILQNTLPILPLSIFGTPENDTLMGNSANNILVGGKGNDILVGGLGADTFKWMDGDQGTGNAPSVDTVVGFTEVPLDELELSGLLTGEHATVDSLVSYLHFVRVGNDTIVDIKSTGAGAVDQRIILQGVDLTANGAGPAFNDGQIIGQLLARSQLQVDT